jgi:hypothetical protein
MFHYTFTFDLGQGNCRTIGVDNDRYEWALKEALEKLSYAEGQADLIAMLRHTPLADAAVLATRV